MYLSLGSCNLFLANKHAPSHVRQGTNFRQGHFKICCPHETCFFEWSSRFLSSDRMGQDSLLLTTKGYLWHPPHFCLQTESLRHGFPNSSATQGGLEQRGGESTAHSGKRRDRHHSRSRSHQHSSKRHPPFVTYCRLRRDQSLSHVLRQGVRAGC